MALIEAVIGLVPRKRGFAAPSAIGQSELSAAVLVQEAGGRYTEAAWNGILYTASSGLVATPAAGPLGAAGTPLLALVNPKGSGYVAALFRAAAVWTALGTTSGKGFELDGGATTDVTAATNITLNANKLGAGADGDLKGYSNTALTGASALPRIRPLSGIGNGTAAAFLGQTLPEEIGGAILVPPGSAVAITALALGVANEAIAALEYAKLLIA